MSEERRTRELSKVAAALEIAQMARHTLADGIEQNLENGWDSEILIFELVRTVGMLVRMSEATPSKLEEMIEFLRRVYSGLSPIDMPTVEEVLKRICPASDLEVVSDNIKAESKLLQ